MLNNRSIYSRLLSGNCDRRSKFLFPSIWYLLEPRNREENGELQMGSIPKRTHFVEQPTNARKRLYYPASIVISDRLPTRRCILRDVGTSGARLSAETIQDVPDKVTLLLSTDGNVFRLCQTEWRFDNQTGVRFLEGGNAVSSQVASSDVELILI